MRKVRSDGQSTKERLLAAASEVFAHKGFWKATNADICQKANANIASINYHFGSKETLYVEAWLHSFRKSVEKHPPDKDLHPEDPAEERFGGYVRSMMKRLLDPESYSFDIMEKERANPTGLLSQVVHESVVEGLHRHLEYIIRELLGDKAVQEDVFGCTMSVKTQCFGVMLRYRRFRQNDKLPPPCDLPDDFDAARFSEHIIRFSLAGIREIRDRAEQASRDPGASNA